MKRSWSKTQKTTLKKLSDFDKIARFLDELPYNTDAITRSAGAAIDAKKAHCFDGALLAAAALEFHGSPPLLVDLRSNGRDDDHVLALIRHKKAFGAVAKSNFAGLRFREPVYRSLRELVMSYFHSYFNLERERTLREYSQPIDLTRITMLDWRFSEQDITPLGEELDRARHYKLLDRAMEKKLHVVDQRLFEAETLRMDPRGVFRLPEGKS